MEDVFKVEVHRVEGLWHWVLKCNGMLMCGSPRYEKKGQLIVAMQTMDEGCQGIEQTGPIGDAFSDALQELEGGR